MNSKKLKETLASLCFGASALILALALFLAPSQTAFAGADPLIPPHLMANTSVGTADGGPGSIPIDERASSSRDKKTPTATRFTQDSGGAAYGAWSFGKGQFGYYFGVFSLVRTNVVFYIQSFLPLAIEVENERQ